MTLRKENHMKKVKEFDINTNQKWIEEYGCNAENPTIIKVDPKKLPVKFQKLIPYVEKYWIGGRIFNLDLSDIQLNLFRINNF